MLKDNDLTKIFIYFDNAIKQFNVKLDTYRSITTLDIRTTHMRK